MAESDHLAERLKALATPARVRIVQLLKAGPLCVGALSARLKVTQGAVSQHLRVLRAAGLVVSQRRGTYIHYGLNKKALTAWKKQIDELLTCRRSDKRCCRGLPDMKGRAKCRTTKANTPAKPKARVRRKRIR